MAINTNMDFRKKTKLEPEWIYNSRKSAWNSYNTHPLPDRVKHLWKYTRPESFLIDDSDDISSSSPRFISPDSPASFDSGNYAEQVIVSSDKDLDISLSAEYAAKEIVLCDLQSAYQEYPELVKEHLGKLIGEDFGKFEALNSAIWHNGVFLYVPDDLALTKPIMLMQLPSGVASFSRLLAVFGKNSRATVIDSMASAVESDGGLVNGITELFADDYAQIRYVNLQNLHDSFKSYITQRAKIGRQSSIYSIFGGLGCSLSKVNAGTILAGKQAESRIYGVVFADNKQHFDYHTLHHHQTEDSYSDIDFKVVLKDKATSAYTGLIKIDEATKNCQAYQINRNLILNKGPKAESIPELEILTDEVQCSHGATMGPIDPEMLFYLKSRGLNEEDAVRTIIEGFIEPTAAQLPDELAETMRRMVITKLEGN